MSDKRLTRHEMKEPDQFLSALDRAVAYARANPQRMLAAGLGVIAAAAIAIAATTWLSARDDRANVELAAVLETYRKPVATVGLDDALETFPDQTSKDAALMSAAQEMVDKHGGARSVRAAKLMQAYALSQGAQHAEAARLYGEVASPNPNDVLAAAAALGEATSRAAAGEPQAAIDQLKRLAGGTSPYVPKDLVLERAAAIAQQADQLEEALTLYRRLSAESDNDLVRRRAEAKVGELQSSLDVAATTAADG